MNPLTYSAKVLGYTVNPNPEQILKDKKINLIYDINTIQMALNKPALTWEQFVELYDNTSLLVLTQMVNDQASLLSRVKERNLLY